MPDNNKPTHNLCLKKEYVDKEWEKKITWVNIMWIWENEKWLIINLPRWLSLSWTLYIFKNKVKEEGEWEWANWYDDDELPF